MVKMKPEDFVSFEDSVNFKKLLINDDTNGDHFTLFDIHEMRYRRGFVGFDFKHLPSDATYRSCDFGPQTRLSRRPNMAVFGKLQPLYPASGVPISTAKYTDIMSLLKYVPPIHHGDYTDLKHSMKRKNTFK